MKDYDITIHYHPGKANVVADALSRKSDGSLAVMITRQAKLLRDLEELQIKVKPAEGSGRLGRVNQVRVQFDLRDRIVGHRQRIIRSGGLKNE